MDITVLKQTKRNKITAYYAHSNNSPTSFRLGLIAVEWRNILREKKSVSATTTATVAEFGEQKNTVSVSATVTLPENFGVGFSNCQLLKKSVSVSGSVSVSATGTCGSLNENGVGFSNCHLAEKIGIGFQQLPIAEKKNENRNRVQQLPIAEKISESNK